MVFVEFLSGFAALTASKAEIIAAFLGAPALHGIPEGTTNALTTDACVGNEVFEVGVFASDRPHRDR